jgi:hypothetical protein
VITSATVGTTVVHATTTVTVGGVSLTRATGDGLAGDSANAQKKWVDANIAITPATATNATGTNHVLTITVNALGGTIDAGSHTATASIVSGPGSFVGSASCTYTGGGATASCTVTITSATPGTTVVSATSDIPVNGVTITRTTGTAANTAAGGSGNASKSWVDANIQITPATASNKVGTNHVLTITVNALGGTIDAGPHTATASIVSGPGSFVGSPTCTYTGGAATASCTVTITSAVTGTTVVSATSNIPVNGVTITRTTGTAANTAAGGSGNASKAWVNARISIAPSATNEVGQSHTFTVTLEKDTGNGAGFQPAAGEHVDVTLTDSNGASHTAPTGSCTNAGANTNASGQCTITFTSNSAGKVTGHATSTLSIGGVSITVQTDGVAPNSADAVKTFVDASISITPTATNGITESHTFTVHVEANDGSGSGFQPVSGVKPTVSLTNGGGASAINITDNCASTGTDASGNCTVSFTSDNPGTVTGNASITLTVGGVSLTRDTDPATSAGSGPNGSGPAVKTFIAGSLSWLKHDNNGNLLGGATFQVCATGGTAGGLSPQCVSVTDNSSPDADPTAGQFKLNAYQSFGGSALGGLALGTYTIEETSPPAGYTGDSFVETITIDASNLNATATHIWVNTPPQEGCTPGFWQGGLGVTLWDQTNDPDWTSHGGAGTNPFITTTLFNDFFAPWPGEAGKTMLDLVSTGGGPVAADKAARMVVAAYLNAAFGLNFPYTTTQVAQMWADAVAAGTDAAFTDVFNKLGAANNLMCPIS